MRKTKLVGYLEEVLELWDNPVENQSKLELLKQKLYGNTRIYKILEKNQSIIHLCNALIEDINNKIVRTTFSPRILHTGSEPIDCVQNIVTLCNYTSTNITIVLAYRLAEDAGIQGDWKYISRNTRIQDINTAMYHVENLNKDKCLGSIRKRVENLRLKCTEIEQLIRLTGDADTNEIKSINQFIERLAGLNHRNIKNCIKILRQVVDTKKPVSSKQSIN